MNELYSSTRLPFPDCTKDLTTAHAKSLGEEYLSKIRGRFGVAARRITDKMPQNFLYVGLISQILPEARFIYMKRNPLDVALGRSTVIEQTGLRSLLRYEASVRFARGS